MRRSLVSRDVIAPLEQGKLESPVFLRWSTNKAGYNALLLHLENSRIVEASSEVERSGKGMRQGTS